MNKPQKLGELLLAEGKISASQLAIALQEQKLHGGRLGTILVSLGYVTTEDINKAIPPPPPTRLGERLIENGAITEEQLREALAYQQENGGLLGEALVALGYTSSEIIESEGIKQVSDTGELEKIVNELIAGNASQVAEYKAGKIETLNWFVGQVMKATRGQANPAVVMEVLKKLLG